MIRALAPLVGLFLLAGCEEAKKPNLADQRRSENVEDCRTCPIIKPEKPKTAYLLNGLGVYGKPGMMGAIQVALEKRGWKVTVLNHTDGKRLTHMPRVLIGHSMGANAALKRSQIFIRNHPDLIVSIDAGRAPLFHRAPESKARVVDISCPYHPIGGQRVAGADLYREVCGTAHIAMPHDKRVIDIIIKEVEALK
jgi:hypothetical protein